MTLSLVLKMTSLYGDCLFSTEGGNNQNYRRRMPVNGSDSAAIRPARSLILVLILNSCSLTNPLCLDWMWMMWMMLRRKMNETFLESRPLEAIVASWNELHNLIKKSIESVEI